MATTSKFKEYTESAVRWGTTHLSFLRGVGALLFGTALIYLAHRLIVHLIVFTAGVLLIYYGLTELKLKKITDLIDKMIAKLRK